MKRDVGLHIRVNKREYQALSSIAQFEDLSISETTRLILRNACRQWGFSVGEIATPEETNNSNIPTETQQAKVAA